MNPMIPLQVFLLFCSFLTISSGQRIPNKFCDRGYLDSAVRTNSGRIFVFFDSYFVEINKKLKVEDKTPTPIRNVFRGLDFNRIDAAFTADGHNNPLRGKTYLINEKTIKEYSDISSTGLQANMDNWKTMFPLDNVNLVINQIGDSMALFYQYSSGQMLEYRWVLYLFDSLTEPSEVPVSKFVETTNLIETPFSDRRLTLKAVIGLSNNSYLVLYNSIDRTSNGKYCLTESLSKGCLEFYESKTLCNNAIEPTKNPSIPNRTPTSRPTQRSTPRPTQRPTPRPTQRTTPRPTQRPTPRPTQRPTPRPTQRTTPRPTQRPTSRPTERPTPRPTQRTTPRPTQRPTPRPTQRPTPRPTQRTTPISTQRPTSRPTERPTSRPTERLTETTSSGDKLNTNPNDKSVDKSGSSWLLVVILILILVAIISLIFWTFFMIFGRKNRQKSTDKKSKRFPKSKK